MVRRAPCAEGKQLLEQVFGYLNFSSGAADPQFLTNLNELFRLYGGEAAPGRPAGRIDRWRTADGTTTSETEFTAVATTGIPHTMASTTAVGNPS